MIFLSCFVSGTWNMLECKFCSARDAVAGRVKRRKIQTSAVLSVEVEKGLFCYELRMSSALKWITSIPCVLENFRGHSEQKNSENFVAKSGQLPTSTLL